MSSVARSGGTPSILRTHDEDDKVKREDDDFILIDDKDDEGKVVNASIFEDDNLTRLFQSVEFIDTLLLKSPLSDFSNKTVTEITIDDLVSSITRFEKNKDGCSGVIFQTECDSEQFMEIVYSTNEKLYYLRLDPAKSKRCITTMERLNATFSQKRGQQKDTIRQQIATQNQILDDMKKPTEFSLDGTDTSIKKHILSLVKDKEYTDDKGKTYKLVADV